MAVREVFIPPRTDNIDPVSGTTVKKEGEPGYWERQAKEERAKREFLEERKMAENITNPPSPQEPPIKMSGNINLGNFDFQEQQKLSQAELLKSREEASARVDKLEKERDEAKEELNHAKIEHMTEVLNGKIGLLAEAVKSGMNQKSFMEQYQEVAKMASDMGFVSPFSHPKAGEGNIGASLDMLRLQQDMNRENREFQRQMKKDEREWTLELKKLERDDRLAQQKLDNERQKMEALYSIPERLGNAAGKAIADGALDRIASKPKGEHITENSPTPVSAPTAPANTANHHVEAGLGDSGEFDCPDCGKPIGIGPDTMEAVCGNCGNKFPVRRIGGK